MKTKIKELVDRFNLIPLFVALVLFGAAVFQYVNIKHDTHRRVQRERFDRLQNVLVENQIAVRDSIIASASAKIDSLSSQLLLYNTETIWLARGIYSETNDPIEMYPVAWVIRNRYDVNYGGCSTYKCVILDPLQFSAFNWNSHSRNYYSKKSITDEDHTWSTALNVAAEVIAADTTERPFDLYTLNFYSPVSMEPQYSVPKWVSDVEEVEIDDIDPSRFKFYKVTPELLTKVKEN